MERRVARRTGKPPRLCRPSYGNPPRHPSSLGFPSPSPVGKRSRTAVCQRQVIVVFVLGFLTFFNLRQSSREVVLTPRVLPVAADGFSKIQIATSELVKNTTKTTMRARQRQDSSYPTEFEKIESANVTWWLDGDDDEQRSCDIGSQLQFIANGGVHFAFSTNYTCRNDSDGTWSEPRKIVVRLAARQEIKPQSLVRYYVSMDNEFERGKAFSRQLKGAWSKDQIDRHFALPKGQVDIPASFFKNFESTLMSHGFVGVDGDSISAELSEFIPGEGHLYWYLTKTKYLTPARRLTVLQDLVKIFRHMRRQGVAHCDMELRHVLVVVDDDHEPQEKAGAGKNELHLTLVDFEYTRYTRNEDMQMFQLWQLMGMMGYTCGKNNQVKKENEYPIKSNICFMRRNMMQLWANVTTYESWVLQDLEQCPFVKPLNWTRDLLTDVPKAYRTLSELVGLPVEDEEGTALE